MRRRLALWLLLLMVMSVGAAVTYVRCPGCIPRDRVNTACQWTGDARFPIDPQNATHRAHLVADAQLAEELGIRYADAEFGRRSGGIEHHGGLLDDGRVRAECLAKMFQAIEVHHGATPDEIRLARGERTPGFDAAVALLFLPFYALAAARVCGWLNRRFPSDERYARWIATGLVSVGVALLGIQCFRLWGAIWEVIRVGNGHMTSIRAASSTRWVQHYAGADFLGALVVFWLVALIGYRVVTDNEQAAGAGAPAALFPRSDAGHRSLVPDAEPCDPPTPPTGAEA